jgi:PAS domain S-box-containing protein|uniref:Serine/threonine protein kinase n=1 Tax=Desulfobacca acetoxidans TaxID=60893 RepID=A0A7C3V613_9BACT
MEGSQRIWLSGSPAAAAMLEKILIGGGYDVKVKGPDELTATSPADLPDLLILAEEPPRLTRLMTSLRSQPPWRDIPIIAALTRFSDALAAQTLGLGADEFLMAPFQPQDVLARVMVILRLHQQRRLLVSSQTEFARVFSENPTPLFYCDRQGRHCRLNPSLERLLGYSSKKGEEAPEDINELLFEDEDRERFRRAISRPAAAGRVKVRLKGRKGQPVTVLLTDLTGHGPASDRVGFEIQPVGSPSPLKRALHSLVENFLPAARDYLSLLEMTPLLGGRYEKLKKLGQGSFGEVWLVRDTEQLEGPREYVAKIPFSRAANAKFRQEAEICRRLSPHPGVVKLVDILEDEDRVVLIQEYLPGRTLEDMLSEEIPRPLVERLIMQLIEVVAHAHAHRIMHRDIKPGNIMVLPDGTLKLLDFGAAKILKDKDISATMVGSRPFMAPEQIMGKSEIRSDIWAIGVIMYMLYTEELPFYSEVEKLLIDQILEKEPTPPRQLHPELPPALEAIILRCLAKDVDRRYASALDLKAELLKHFPHYGEPQD